MQNGHLEEGMNYGLYFLYICVYMYTYVYVHVCVYFFNSQMEYSIEVKRNQLNLHIRTSVNLKNVMLSDKSKFKKICNTVL